MLKRQGLTQRQPFGSGRRATERAVQHLGYVQIDTISVVERAHHHVLASRNDDHSEDKLAQALERQDVFEYWFHAAAVLPMAHYRFALPRMLAARAARHPGRSTAERRLEQSVLDRIRVEGPLAARDFDGQGGGSGWWDWKPAKRALERLFYEGELMVVGRNGFQKRFDLTERALPPGTDQRPPSAAEEASHLIDQALRSVGYTTVPEATYLRRDPALRAAVVTELERRTMQRAVLPLKLPDGRVLWVDAEGYEARRPTLSMQLKVLSPFDNLCIQRRRLLDLFDFDYQLECYLPAPKRRFGYYVLPLLQGDRFIGRLDAKHHRDQGLLAINGLFLEAGADAEAINALPAGLAAYARRQQARRIELPPRIDGLSITARRDLERRVRRSMQDG